MFENMPMWGRFSCLVHFIPDETEAVVALRRMTDRRFKAGNRF
ncbi:hypothetical protein [Gluconacetobacter aggeris]|nr:hypothetical protein [Gluconacetobacter aggeris]